MSNLNVKQLKTFFNGNNSKYKQQTFAYLLKNKKDFPNFFIEEYTRKQVREISAMQIKKLFRQFIPQKQIRKDPNIMTKITSAIYSYELGLSVKMGVHYFLYYKTLFYLGTQRHQSYRQRALKLDDIGCFGLTQLMHGSNVRGILTQAHYDHSTRQFIMNTPTQDAMKFWIGAAANIANMCVYWAQLYVNGKCYGVHCFVVPIRDLETHRPLPGVTIGDCGPKNGQNCIDNGFIILKKVRIPKDNLLNRYSDINEKGEFVTKIQSADKRFGLQLGALTGGRAHVSLSSSTLSSSALTIGFRYMMVRKQFGLGQNKQICLFQYPLSKYRMIPLLAKNIIYQILSTKMIDLWDQSGQTVLDPKNVQVQMIHAVLSVLKASSSWFASQVISECRQIMGGHGYSTFSKMGTLYNDNDVNLTWQGDNNVLLMQTSKFCLDGYRKVMKGKSVHPSLNFIKNQIDVPDFNGDLNDFDLLGRILQFRLQEKLKSCINKMMQLKGQGKSDIDIMNITQPGYLKTLALYFGDYHFLTILLKQVQTLNQPNKSIILSFAKLWIFKILQNYGTQQFKQRIIESIINKCDELSIHCAKMIDAISPPADIIGSPHGCDKGLGFGKYLGLIYGGKETFNRVKWWKKLH